MFLAANIIPPTLREGDCLTAAEFLRRWQAMPDPKHAEMIDGIVFYAAGIQKWRWK